MNTLLVPTFREVMVLTYSTFHVFDCTTAEVICEFKGKIPPDQFADLLIEASRRYADAMICPENNTYGYAVLNEAKRSWMQADLF